MRTPGAAVSPAVASNTTSSEYKHQRCSNEDAQMHSQNVYKLAHSCGVIQQIRCFLALNGHLGPWMGIFLSVNAYLEAVILVII